jgi:hypothetical protein
MIPRLQGTARFIFKSADQVKMIDGGEDRAKLPGECRCQISSLSMLIKQRDAKSAGEGKQSACDSTDQISPIAHTANRHGVMTPS